MNDLREQIEHHHFVAIPSDPQQPIQMYGAMEQAAAECGLDLAPGRLMRFSVEAQHGEELNFTFVYNLAEEINWRAAALLQRCVGMTFAITGTALFIEPPIDALVEVLKQKPM